MKISSRLTSCESCRKLKRKCDFLQSEGGPCSNCKMRNIGDSCSFGKDTDSLKRTSSAMSMSSTTSLSSTATIASVPSLSSSSFSSASSSNTHTVSSASTASSSPNENYSLNSKRIKLDNIHADEPLATVNTHTRIPVKFLSSCAVRFSKSPEMSFYVDLEQLITTVVDLGRPSSWNGCSIVPDNHPPTPPSPLSGEPMNLRLINHQQAPAPATPAKPYHPPDLAAIALLYIVCATVIVRRGAKVAPSSNFSGTREQLANELVEIHSKAVEQINTVSLQLCQALMVRAQYHSIIDQSEIAWEVLERAIKLFDQLPLPSAADDFKYCQAYNGSLIYLGYLESTICVYANKPYMWTERILNFQLDEDVSDFHLRRRLRVLQYMRRVQLIINQPLDTTPTYEEQDSLEQELMDYIELVDAVEGTMLPYGQIFLLLSLVKLRTHMLMRLSPNADPDGLMRNKYLARLSEHGDRVIKYLEIVTRMWYSGNSRRSSIYFLGSSQFLAVHIFQGLTCIWILSALTRNEPDGAVFGNIRDGIWANIERLRNDMKICRRTHVLFKGIDFLSNAQQEGTLAKIPAEFHTGIESIAKSWNDSIQEPWLDFQNTFDDSFIWSFVLSQSTFDDSLEMLLANSDDQEPLLLN